MTVKLKKVTLRLPEGLPAELSRLTGLGYNEAIRAVLKEVVAKLRRQESEAPLRYAGDINLADILEAHRGGE